MRTPLRCVLGFALAGLVLGACSDDDDQPGTLPDVTPSTTSVESTSATPSGDPTAQLEAEITAFYEEYVDTINESWASEEALERRRNLFSDSCDECLVGFQFAQRAHLEGLTLQGEPAVVHRVRLDSVRDDVVTFATFSDVPAARLVDPQGAVVLEFEAGPNTQTIYQAQRTGRDRWIIIAGETLS
jgi:hypothetical protein